MRAITIWQPWASLIFAGVKPYEFRPKSFRAYVNAPQVGERIAIQAGARKVKLAEVQDLRARLQSPLAWSTCLRPIPEALALLDRIAANPSMLPRSHVLGTVVLGEPVESWKIVGEFGRVDAVSDSDRAEMSNWAWPLLDIQPLEPPVPQGGSQGFFRWDDGRAAA